MAKDSVVDPAARDKYLLQVTAGPTYDPKLHQDVPVNGSDNTTIDSDLCTTYLKVRIKDYNGLPHGSPSTSPYFQHELHTADRYSIAYSFVPKKDFNGKDVVFGFDYDHSIKHQLPPGFKYAMKIATTLLDPGLYSDAYCDEPYLYGPALSGLFTLNIGEKVEEVSAEQQLANLEKETGGVVEEGSSCSSGAEIRSSLNIPSKFKKRRRFFLTPENLAAFTFERGRMYHADFFNPHLDFANFSLRLPGFSISVAKYIDEKTHHLRYVLKNRATDEVFFVVFFKLLFGQELERTLDERKGGNKEAERRVSQQIEKKENAPVVDGGLNATQGGVTRDGNVSETKAEQPRAQPAPQMKEEADGEEVSSYSPTAAVTSLSNNIYAALLAVGLWDDTSSSSDDRPPKQDPSPQPTGQSLDSCVEAMDDATIEKYLQSRQGNIQ